MKDVCKEADGPLTVGLCRKTHACPRTASLGLPGVDQKAMTCYLLLTGFLRSFGAHEKRYPCEGINGYGFQK